MAEYPAGLMFAFLGLAAFVYFLCYRLWRKKNKGGGTVGGGGGSDINNPPVDQV